MKYNLVSLNDGSASLTLVVNGDMYVADDGHPNFKSIVAGVLAGDESVTELFNIEAAVSKRFETLSERVSVKDGQVYFDGEPVNNALTEQVLRFLDEGEDFKPLVNFFEKVATNPNPHSREQFYAWLNTAKFTILPDGDVLAYKGVYKTGNADAPFESVSRGTAVVNGVQQTGAIKQGIGDIVTMPRGDVEFSPGVACAQGLHAGTWEYASTFVSGPNSAILTVRFSPRDVVSVPTDCAAQKVRVCRYVVVDVTDAPLDRALAQEPVKVEDLDGDTCVSCDNAFEACCAEDQCDDCFYSPSDEEEVEEEATDVCKNCEEPGVANCCWRDYCDDCGDEREEEGLPVTSV